MIDRGGNTDASYPYAALKRKYTIQAQLDQPPLGAHQDHAGATFNNSAASPHRRGMESTTGMLERIGCGYLVMASDRRVIDWNSAALDTLERQGEVVETAVGIASALKRLVENVPGQFPAGSLSWVVFRSRGDRPVILNEDGITARDGTSIIAFLDRENRSGANPHTLQKMFGLTGAETHLALRLAHGDAPLEIARSWRLSRTTIRSQLASLFAKTDTKRQAELVALLGRIAVLP